MTIFSDRTGRAAGLILLAFAGLAIAFTLIVPPFEAPDELYHYGFVRYVAGGNGLPVQSTVSTGPWEQEGSQAPLYYLLAGALSAGVDQADFDALAVRNPHANIGDPLYPGNKNRMLYSAAPHPLAGANLALHLGRWLSALLGLITLFFTWRTARLALPGRDWAALTALAIVAFLPQFGFINGSLNNDTLVTAVAAATVYWLARLLAMPQAETPSVRDWLVLGALLGLAALSKLQGLGLFVLAGAVVLFMAWQRRDWRLPLRALLPVALPALLIAGWWYVRNVRLYGDPFGLSNLLEINGRRRDPLTWDGFLREFRGLRYSFWGLFGWFNILLPGWIYRVLDGFTLVSFVGLLIWSIRRSAGPAAAGPAARVRLLLLAWAVLSLLLLLYWTSQATGSQGRLLFPGLSAFAVLLVGGLEVWLDYLPRGRRWARAALPGLLLAATCWALAVLLPHAYHAPGPVAAPPAPALPLDLRYGHDAQLRLDAITLPATRFRPGESVPVTLYERAPEAVDQDYRLFIQLLDNERNVLGNVTTHPGWGRNPTTLWRANALYPDAYRVQIQEDIDPRSPLLATVYAGFIDPAAPAGSENPLPAADGAAAAVTPFLGNVVIEPLRPPDDAGLTPLAVQFGDVIELKGMDAPAQAAPGASIPVRLLWRGLGPPAADYIVFVHLRSPDGERVAGFDAPPGQGRFPTGYWQAGDEILSEFALDLPEGLAPGVYDVWIGLYAADSGGTLRLSVTREDDRLTGDGEVLAETVAVE